MTEETNDILNTPLVEDPLTVLKAKADLMGITYHPSIGLAALESKIQAKKSGEPMDAFQDTPDAPAAAPEGETDAQRRVRLKNEAMELIRVRITCMNPNKQEFQGEIFSTGNNIVGTIRKFVLFDAEYHIERMLLDMVMEKQYQAFYTVTDKSTGRKTRKGRLVKEFGVEILPSLTSAELHDLAQRQAMANGTAD